MSMEFGFELGGPWGFLWLVVGEMRVQIDLGCHCSFRAWINFINAGLSDGDENF